MPVSFLSEDQRTRYGHYAGELTAEQLARCFHLNDADRELIAVRRGDHNRLGFALQLCTVRFLSTFLEDLQSIPAGVVNNVARQLAIDNPSCHAQYCAGEQRWEHAAEIRTRYGYQDFSAAPQTRPMSADEARGFGPDGNGGSDGQPYTPSSGHKIT
jgi:hypothetical protein